MSPPRVTITLYLALTWLTLFFAKWYSHFVYRVYETKQKYLSIMKFADFVKEHFLEIIKEPDLEIFVNHLAYYYSHDKRKRPNYLELLYHE